MNRSAEFLLKFLDGTLAAGDARELDALLAADPGAEAEHLAILEVEANLRGLRTGFDLSDATLASISEAQAERTAAAVLCEIDHRLPPAWARSGEPAAPARQHWRVAVGVAVACAAAVLVAVWSFKPDELPAPNGQPAVVAPRAFAKLSRKSGVVEVVFPTGEAVRAEEGGDLPDGFTLRTVGDNSLAVVDLPADDSRFEIESDSEVRFRGGAPEHASQPQLFLAAGQLTAAVGQRPDGRPLIVGTPVAQVFALGGLFIVSSAGPDSARVDIRRGNVELVRTNAPTPVAVGVGSALVTAGFDQVHFEQSQPIDRVPKRALSFHGARAATFSPDGAEVWVANAKVFTRWTPAGTTETGFYPRRGFDGVAAFSRDKRLLATFRGGANDRVLLRTLPDGGEHAAVNMRPNETRYWTMAPDASWFALVEPKPKTRVRVFDGATGDERFQRDFEDEVGCVAASPDAKVLAVGLNDLGRGANNKVVLVDAATGARLSALPTQKKALTAMAYSDDGRFLAVGFNGVVQLWDVRTRELVRAITGFERALTCLAFAPDGKRLAAGTQDGYVWVWRTDNGEQTQLIEAGGRGVRAIAFAPDGRQLVTVANSAPVAVWDIHDAPGVQ